MPNVIGTLSWQVKVYRSTVPLKTGFAASVMLYALLQFMICPGTAFSAEVNPVRTSMDSQIEALSDREGAVRDKAAEAIRNALANTGGSFLGEKDQSYWEKRLQAITIGMSKNEVEKLFPSQEESQPTLGQGMGSHSVSKRLDNNWEATLYYDPSGKIQAAPKLHASTLSVWVPPSDTYTGKWTVYFVNGQKAQEIEYKDGEYNGTFISYYANGNKSYRQHYIDGMPDGLDEGWHLNGTPSYTGQYKNRRQDGLWIWWNPDGSKQDEAVYKDGKR